MIPGRMGLGMGGMVRRSTPAAGSGNLYTDQTADWTVSRCTIDDDTLNLVNSSGFAGSAAYTVPGGIVDGSSYNLSFIIEEFVAAPISRSISLGLGDTVNYVAADGPVNLTLIAGASNEILRFSCNNNSNYKIRRDSITLTPA